MDALGERFVAAMGLNPLCAQRMRFGHIVHHAFQLCDTHIATRPVVVSAAAQLLECSFTQATGKLKLWASRSP